MSTGVTADLAHHSRKRPTLNCRLAGLWLIVAAILAHAMLPSGSALQRSSGSAFSATTSDVTTIPRRERDKERAGASQADGSFDERGAGDAGAAILPAHAGAVMPAAEHAPYLPLASAQAPPRGPPSSFKARAPPALLPLMA